MDTSEDSTFLQDMLMGNTLHLLIKVRVYFSSHQYMNELVLAHFSDPTLSVLRELAKWMGSCCPLAWPQRDLTHSDIYRPTHSPALSLCHYLLTQAYTGIPSWWNLLKAPQTLKQAHTQRHHLLADGSNESSTCCLQHWARAVGWGVASREGEEVEGEEETVIKPQTELSWTSGRSVWWDTCSVLAACWFFNARTGSDFPFDLAKLHENCSKVLIQKVLWMQARHTNSHNEPATCEDFPENALSCGHEIHTQTHTCRWTPSKKKKRRAFYLWVKHFSMSLTNLRLI